MIKAVIFDVGGVLVRTENPAVRRGLEERMGMAQGDAEATVFNSDMGRRAQRGAITTAELWAWVQQHLGLDAETLHNFQRDFFGGDVIDHALIDFARDLRAHYQVAIISNAMDNLNTFVRELDPDGDVFELVVGSAYEKVMKPDPAIFLRTLERLGRQPDEAVFIDDFAHNIAGARAVGMHVIHFTAGIDLPTELEKLGVTK